MKQKYQMILFSNRGKTVRLNFNQSIFNGIIFCALLALGVWFYQIYRTQHLKSQVAILSHLLNQKQVQHWRDQQSQSDILLSTYQQSELDGIQPIKIANTPSSTENETENVLVAQQTMQKTAPTLKEEFSSNELLQLATPQALSQDKQSSPKPLLATADNNNWININKRIEELPSSTTIPLIIKNIELSKSNDNLNIQLILKNNGVKAQITGALWGVVYFTDGKTSKKYTFPNKLALKESFHLENLEHAHNYRIRNYLQPTYQVPWPKNLTTQTIKLIFLGLNQENQLVLLKSHISSLSDVNMESSSNQS